MIARGALIKPWIFTELKERRDCESAVVARFQVLHSLTSLNRGHFVPGASRHDRETVQLWTRALGTIFFAISPATPTADESPRSYRARTRWVPI